MHTHSCVCTHTHSCVCTHTQLCMYTHTVVYVHTHSCVCTHTHSCVCTHTHSCVCTHTHSCVCTHTHTHTQQKKRYTHTFFLIQYGTPDEEWETDVPGKKWKRAVKFIFAILNFAITVTRAVLRNVNTVDPEVLDYVDAGLDAVENQLTADPDTSIGDRLAVAGIG